MICNKLFSSLAALETESFEIDLRGTGGGLPSVFTSLFLAISVPDLLEIIRLECASVALWVSP